MARLAIGTTWKRDPRRIPFVDRRRRGRSGRLFASVAVLLHLWTCFGGICTSAAGDRDRRARFRSISSSIDFEAVGNFDDERVGLPRRHCGRGPAVGLRFRDAFLGTVAAGALSLAFGGPALAGPVPAACRSERHRHHRDLHRQSIRRDCQRTDLPPPVTTLNVNNLTQAITPASGTAGISFTSAGAVTITSNTGAFGITTAATRTGFMPLTPPAP